MKQLLTHWLVGLIALVAGGCATPRNYLHDRTNDALDVFTVTGGKGVGAAVRCGPVHVGLLGYRDACGVIGGHVMVPSSGDLEMESYWVDPLIGVPTGDGFLTGEQKLWAYASGEMKMRAKCYSARGQTLPFIMTPGRAYECYVRSSPATALSKYPHYYWSQVEVAVGLWWGVRLGFNPGELLDFLSGWFGADMYGDDLDGLRADDVY